jgi:hypothetical protein
VDAGVSVRRADDRPTGCAGETARASIVQPDHTLHFTLGDAASGWTGSRRVVDVTALAAKRLGTAPAAAAASASLAQSLLATPLRADITRR